MTRPFRPPVGALKAGPCPTCGNEATSDSWVGTGLDVAWVRTLHPCGCQVTAS